MRYLSGIATMLLAFGLVGWVMLRSMAKSDEPGRLVAKWVISIVLLGIAFAVGAGSKSDDPSSAFIVPIGGAVIGVILGIIWAPSLGALVSKPFSSMYDGGDAEVEMRPLYSIAQARRKQGKYHEAIAAIREQLENFPHDFPGWMMLAEIQGENLNDPVGAQETVEIIVSQPGHAPKNIAFALFRSADWHLKAQDRASAQSSLQRIIDLLPDTEQSLQAAQRLAHLGSDEMIASRHTARVISLPAGPQSLGVDPSAAGPALPADPVQTAAQLVRHLDEHPLDNEAREQLALIYAHHYRRLDLASDQLEQMIAAPNQLPKHVVKWLNLLADLHIRLDGHPEKAREALQRVIAKFPNSAAAANAGTRIAHLKLEMRTNQASEAVKMGTYEQNIGLKRRS